MSGRRNLRAWVTMAVFAGVICICQPKVEGVIFDDGQLHIIDYETFDSAVIYDYVIEDISWPTTVHVVSGGSLYFVGVYDTSKLSVFDGGSIWDIVRVYDTGMCEIFEGGFAVGLGTWGHSTAIVHGPVGEGVGAHNYSEITLSEGAGIFFFASNNSKIIITGRVGFMADLDSYANDNSEIEIFGGSVSERSPYSRILAYDNSHITFYGSDFRVNGISVGYGEIPGGYSYITGIGPDGDLINLRVHAYDNASIMLVPEPTSMLLLAFGALFMRRKRDR